MSEELAETVRSILDEVPCTDQALAREAGVSQSTVSRIRHGERGCSAEVAEALADALGRWAYRCEEAEGDLRHAIDQEGSDE